MPFHIVRCFLLAASIVAAVSLCRLQAAQPAPEKMKVAGAEDLIFPRVPRAKETEIAGLPEGGPADILTWERVYRLALRRSRSPEVRLDEAFDADALDEQTRTLGLEDFTRFRDDFLGIRGQANQPARPFRDPSAIFFDVLRRRQAIETARWSVGLRERCLATAREVLLGEAMGLTQIDVDACDQAVQDARRRLVSELTGYRDRLDELKVELGLSPHAAVIPNPKGLAIFVDTFNALHQWFTSPSRELVDLPGFRSQLPSVDDMVLELADSGPSLSAVFTRPAMLEAVLTTAEQLAIKNRTPPRDSEAGLRLSVRRRVRGLLDIALAYELERKKLILAARQLDQAASRLLGAPGGKAPGPSLFKEVIEYGRQLSLTEDRLVKLWTTSQLERLALHRDLGTFPYKDWTAFYAQFRAVRGDAGDPKPAPNEPPATAKPLTP